MGILLAHTAQGKDSTNTKAATQSEFSINRSVSQALKKAQLAINDGDYTQAQFLLRPIAHQAQGSEAARLLGDIYWHGLGRSADQSEACKWYLISAKGKSPLGFLSTGHCMLQTRLSKQLIKSAEITQLRPDNRYGFTPDTPQYWYLMAAEHGVVSAYCDIGKTFLTTNSGAENSDHLKSAQALQWCARGGYAGDSESQYTVGMIYAAENINQTLPQALWWLQGAASKGHGKAAYALAELYHTHSVLLKKHFRISAAKQQEMVLKWYEMAANLGCHEAYAKTAMLYIKQLDTAGGNKTASTDSNQQTTLLKAYFWLKAARIVASQKPNPGKLDQLIQQTIEKHYLSVAQIVPSSWHTRIAQELLTHFERYPLEKTYALKRPVPIKQTS